MPCETGEGYALRLCPRSQFCAEFIPNLNRYRHSPNLSF
jgi:hypothetical protein